MSKVWRATAAPSTRTLAPAIQPAAARKRGGHRERPSSSLVARWTGARTANNPISAAIRTAARNVRRALAGSAIAVEGDAVQLHSVVDEAEAELLGNLLLKQLEFVVGELDDIAGL